MKEKFLLFLLFFLFSFSNSKKFQLKTKSNSKKSSKFQVGFKKSNGAMCRNLYERCFIDQSGVECCKGLVCNTEGGKVGVCLKEEFASCKFSRACGYGLSCEAGFCVQGQNQCKKMDQTCEKFTDCCPDMLCNKNSKCTPCHECRTIGETCLYDSHCKFWFGSCNSEVCTECPDVKKKTRCIKQNYLCKKDEHCRPGLRCLFDENEGDYFCTTPLCEYCEEKEGPPPPDIQFPAEEYMKQIWLDPDAPDKLVPKKKDKGNQGGGAGNVPPMNQNSNSGGTGNNKPFLIQTKENSMSDILATSLADYRKQLNSLNTNFNKTKVK